MIRGLRNKHAAITHDTLFRKHHQSHDLQKQFRPCCRASGCHYEAVASGSVLGGYRRQTPLSTLTRVCREVSRCMLLRKTGKVRNFRSADLDSHKSDG